MERSLQALNRQESFTVPSVVESNTVFYSLTETAVSSKAYLSEFVVQTTNGTWAEELIPA